MLFNRKLLKVVEENPGKRFHYLPQDNKHFELFSATKCWKLIVCRQVEAVIRLEQIRLILQDLLIFFNVFEKQIKIVKTHLKRA